jgi:hypothetical protein
MRSTKHITCMIKQLLHNLFPGKKIQPPHADALTPAPSEIATLRAQVSDLLLEVEAIREVLLKSPLGQGGAGSPYAIAYRKTAFLTHDSTGPTSGHEKLMHQFYHCTNQNREWREFLFMHRLGFSKDDISQYTREAQSAETYT